jgi:cellulose synthase/poly-beta-1,6-N-acetylglucosamine synthase-like glycosyltransferase
MANPRLISFVVPAWNEESVLGPTLEALTAAARDLDVPSEVIVADDSSTDRTAQIARQHGARVISVHHRQISATRNAGARDAHGDVLTFIDADTIVTSHAVCAAVEAVRAGAIGGGCAIRYTGRIPAYLRVFIPIEVWLAQKMRIAFGCFLFCTRQAFDAVGGFDTTIYATEEVTMSLALHHQGRFVCLPECVSTSGRKLRTHSTVEWFSQIYRITLGRQRYIRDRGAMAVWYGDRRPDPELSKP